MGVWITHPNMPREEALRRRQLIAAAGTVSVAALGGCVRIDSVENDEVSVETGDFDVNAQGSGEDGSSESSEDDEEDGGGTGNEDSAGDDTGNGPALTILESSTEEMGFTTLISGTAENTSEEPLVDLDLSATLYSEDGAELESSPTDSIGELGPGETWDFSMNAVGVTSGDFSDYEFTFSTGE